jgi:hypothetical protein
MKQRQFSDEVPGWGSSRFLKKACSVDCRDFFCFYQNFMIRPHECHNAPLRCTTPLPVVVNLAELISEFIYFF